MSTNGMYGDSEGGRCTSQGRSSGSARSAGRREPVRPRSRLPVHSQHLSVVRYLHTQSSVTLHLVFFTPTVTFPGAECSLSRCPPRSQLTQQALLVSPRIAGGGARRSSHWLRRNWRTRALPGYARLANRLVGCPALVAEERDYHATAVPDSAHEPCVNSPFSLKLRHCRSHLPVLASTVHRPSSSQWANTPCPRVACGTPTR
ncbi:hypothetical protein BV25DRAFT_768164 [Artomyces pyxidatus]|uniref:Uncharacterized protein n=1 Tax=Artomyces pyxidatus TaxID=48021 RepID=A0ACB8SYG4_9AGAM|nr:hypothetical protein BV25DRAFT_768164 [Artomyces pyxidatus]